MALSPRHHLLVRVLDRVLLRAEEKHVLQETALMTHHRKRQELSEDSCIQPRLGLQLKTNVNA